ncbi:Na+/H+ antiporter NhaC [Oscillospiraceae bacterium]|nr:Na+/H+ antiporter NhaC [Oscillospiraceae bacterium]BDF76393.1 Na+/H+ antiporter NhaC [Oscillospiraceae bacterium]
MEADSVGRTGGRRPKPWQSALILLTAAGVIPIGVFCLHADTAVLLLADSALCCVLLVLFGGSYRRVEEEIARSVGNMAVPVVRLLAVGLMIGVWMACGTVPYLIYCGMRFLSPGLFLPAVCLLCTAVSTLAGTSWGTVATVGVACMSIAGGLGLPANLAAGAVVTGALFGDKVSPLSDSTALTASLSGTPLMEGIRHALRSTGPAYLVSLVFFLISGLRFRAGTVGGEGYTLILSTLRARFYLHPVLLLPPALLFLLILLKKPTIPAFAAGIASGCVLAVLLQGVSPSALASYMAAGFKTELEQPVLAQMLHRGGVSSMLPTVGLLLSACVFGAPIRASGAMELLLGVIRRRARSAGALANGVLLLHGLFFTVTGSYYVSAPVVASMTAELFPACGLSPKNLMRILQDTGAGLSALVPWSATGVYIATVLGLGSTLDYFLYAPMLWGSILLSLLMGLSGFGLARLPHRAAGQ